MEPLGPNCLATEVLYYIGLNIKRRVMPVCSICAEAYEDQKSVQKHERKKHTDAYKANKRPWELRYKAPAAGLPFCALCSIYIGHEATHSHLSNPGHLANVALASSSVQMPVRPQAEMSTPDMEDIWAPPPSSSRRSKARLAAPADELGRDEEAPLQVSAALTQKCTYHLFSPGNECTRALRPQTMLRMLRTTRTCVKAGRDRVPTG